jgi:hypothetical protein
VDDRKAGGSRIEKCFLEIKQRYSTMKRRILGHNSYRGAGDNERQNKK